jgi:hypothetical protein
MRYATEPSAGDGHGAPTFDPDEVFDQFGARFAMLATPDVTHRFVAQMFSDSASDGPMQPVSVTVRHQIGADIVDVMTRRTGPADDQTLSEHMRGAVTDLLLAGSDSVAPDRLPDWTLEVALRPDPVDAGSRDGLLDGAAGAWREMHDTDLVAYGAQIGDLMVAVVAADHVIDTPAVTLWPE